LGVESVFCNLLACAAGQAIEQAIEGVEADCGTQGARAAGFRLYRVSRQRSVIWEPVLQNSRYFTTLCLEIHLYCICMRAGFWWGNVKGGDHLEDPDIDGRVI
jgi:hypothetical protein